MWIIPLTRNWNVNLKKKKITGVRTLSAQLQAVLVCGVALEDTVSFPQLREGFYGS